MSLPPIDLAVFHDNGYTRQQCRITDLWFWTCDPQRTTCGDTHEDEYSFIGKPLIDGFEQRGRALKDAMREAFLSFFENNQHHRIDCRLPTSRDLRPSGASGKPTHHLTTMHSIDGC